MLRVKRCVSQVRSGKWPSTRGKWRLGSRREGRTYLAVTVFVSFSDQLINLPNAWIRYSVCLRGGVKQTRGAGAKMCRMHGPGRRRDFHLETGKLWLRQTRQDSHFRLCQID